MVETLPLTDTREKCGFFIIALGRHQDSARLSYDFGFLITKNPFSALVPAHNNTVEVFTDNRIIGRLNDGTQPLTALVCNLPVAGVLKDSDRACGETLLIVKSLDGYADVYL